jgi:phenylacetate-CoA ligase
MIVHVESASGAPVSASEASARELTASIKAYVGISVHVQVGGPGSIERSIGKAKRVIDRRSLPAI